VEWIPSSGLVTKVGLKTSRSVVAQKKSVTAHIDPDTATMTLSSHHDLSHRLYHVFMLVLSRIQPNSAALQVFAF
jgi:hypothetical protein